MASIRLVATDLDGTLVRSDETISDRTRETLRRVAATGVPIVLATARPPRVARLFADAAGSNSLLICCNGALVYDAHVNVVVRHVPIAAEVAARLLGLIRQAAPEACFAVEVGIVFAQDIAWATLAGRAVGEPFEVGTPVLHEDPLALCRESVTKLLVRHPTRPIAALLEIVRGLVGDAVVVTHSGGPFVELSAAGVDKADALAALCREDAIDAAEVITFGDMPNDLPMLAFAGLGVAVANAHPEVLAAADHITDSNDRDGVAIALERLVL